MLGSSDGPPLPLVALAEAVGTSSELVGALVEVAEAVAVGVVVAVDVAVGVAVGLLLATSTFRSLSSLWTGTAAVGVMLRSRTTAAVPMNAGKVVVR
jgi:hypothetical protein